MMKVVTSFLLLSPLVAATGSHLKRATVPRQEAVYKSDLFTGTNLKQEQSVLNNSDLTYTTRNGKQYFQPLGAQRAGEKGP